MSDTNDDRNWCDPFESTETSTTNSNNTNWASFAYATTPPPLQNDLFTQTEMDEESFLPFINSNFNDDTLGSSNANNDDTLGSSNANNDDDDDDDDNFAIFMSGRETNTAIVSNANNITITKPDMAKEITTTDNAITTTDDAITTTDTTTIHELGDYTKTNDDDDDKFIIDCIDFKTLNKAKGDLTSQFINTDYANVKIDDSNNAIIEEFSIEPSPTLAIINESSDNTTIFDSIILPDRATSEITDTDVKLIEKDKFLNTKEGLSNVCNDTDFISQDVSAPLSEELKESDALARNFDVLTSKYLLSEPLNYYKDDYIMSHNDDKRSNKIPSNDIFNMDNRESGVHSELISRVANNLPIILNSEITFNDTLAANHCFHDENVINQNDNDHLTQISTTLDYNAIRSFSHTTITTPTTTATPTTTTTTTTNNNNNNINNNSSSSSNNNNSNNNNNNSNNINDDNNKEEESNNTNINFITTYNEAVESDFGEFSVPGEVENDWLQDFGDFSDYQTCNFDQLPSISTFKNPQDAFQKSICVDNTSVINSLFTPTIKSFDRPNLIALKELSNLVMHNEQSRFNLTNLIALSAQLEDSSKLATMALHQDFISLFSLKNPTFGAGVANLSIPSINSQSFFANKSESIELELNKTSDTTPQIEEMTSLQNSNFLLDLTFPSNQMSTNSDTNSFEYNYDTNLEFNEDLFGIQFNIADSLTINELLPISKTPSPNIYTDEATQAPVKEIKSGNEEIISDETKQIISELPEFSFMFSSVLMFPIEIYSN